MRLKKMEKFKGLLDSLLDITTEELESVITDDEVNGFSYNGFNFEEVCDKISKLSVASNDSFNNTVIRVLLVLCIRGNNVDKMTQSKFTKDEKSVSWLKKMVMCGINKPSVVSVCFPHVHFYVLDYLLSKYPNAVQTTNTTSKLPKVYQFTSFPALLNIDTNRKHNTYFDEWLIWAKDFDDKINEKTPQRKGKYTQFAEIAMQNSRYSNEQKDKIVL